MALALITGASSGIGRDLALLAARHGFDVVLVSRSQERLDELAEEVRANGQLAHVIAADLNNPAVPADIARRALEIGPVEVLVNAAGFGDYGAFVDRPWEVLGSLIQVNVTAVTELTRRVVPAMIQQERGRVLNVASTAAFQPTPHFGVYAATKAYILSFSEALHEEVRGTGVTVTVVCPGPTETGFQAVANTEAARVNRFFPMESALVAEAAWDGMMRGKAVVVPGWFNKLNGWFISSFPRPWARKMADVMMRGRVKGEG